LFQPRAKSLYSANWREYSEHKKGNNYHSNVSHQSSRTDSKWKNNKHEKALSNAIKMSPLHVQRAFCLTRVIKTLRDVNLRVEGNAIHMYITSHNTKCNEIDAFYYYWLPFPSWGTTYMLDVIYNPFQPARATSTSTSISVKFSCLFPSLHFHWNKFLIGTFCIPIVICI
jgi:hypothetical protein